MVRAVCFDLGRVVVRICRTWREGVERVGLPYHPVVDEPGNAARRREAVHAHERGALSCDGYFETLAGLSLGLYTAEDVRRVHAAWILGEHEGIAELITQISDAGWTTGCLSNTNASHWAQLSERDARGAARFPAFASLRHRLASHELGLRKPDAAAFDAFSAAAASLPGSIVFFDDLESNVRGARARGWDAVRIDPEAPIAPQVAAALGARGIP